MTPTIDARLLVIAGSERDTAEQAAWAAPGVVAVVDLLTIEP